MTTSRTAFGSVKPFTRHVSSCPFGEKVDHNACRCPKWLYHNRKGSKPRRYTLGTPSWAEAQRIAAQILRGFDPEIAEARETRKQKERSLVPVVQACDLWIERTRRQYGTGGVLPQYKSLMKKVCRWAEAAGIEHVQDITPLALEKWYSSRDWLAHADTTRQQRWGVLRSMFAFLKQRGVIDESPIAAIMPIRLSGKHVQGPYTEEQVARLLAHLKNTDTSSIKGAEKAVYVARLSAFVSLLLHTGCDVVDAVLFDSDRFEVVQLADQTIHVYRYNRRKTGVQAVIPLPEDVVAALRTVPVLPDNPPGMPFRSSSDLRSDVHLWSRRIKRVLAEADIAWVELPQKDARGKAVRKKANAKQLRHTFSVRQLKAGQRPEEVARMLGHVDTSMVRAHYAPWVKELDEAHLRMVTGVWRRNGHLQATDAM